MRLVLDAGHGGNDPGVCYTAFMEKDFNLSMCLMLAGILRKNHPQIATYFTRIDDSTISLRERIDITRVFEPDLFVSIHCNAPATGTGFESYIRRKPLPVEYHIQGIIHDKLAIMLRLLGLKDRGMKQADFYVLTANKCPSILLEMFFLPNEYDFNTINAETNLYQYLVCLGEGIFDAFGKIC